MEKLKIKYIIFYLEGPRLDSELIGFRLVLDLGKNSEEFHRDFGMKTVANNQYDKPYQQVVPIDF